MNRNPSADTQAATNTPLTTAATTTAKAPVPALPSSPDRLALPTWRLNLMRVGYFEMFLGLAIVKWPQFLAHDPWELKEGTVLTMLVAMSVLALFGLRYPQRMLPILLFEVGWKLIWLGAVALPLWLDGDLTGATREQASAVLWFVLIIAVIPWGHVVRQFILARGERWR